jgi:AcrR family transcriptional regulator
MPKVSEEYKEKKRLSILDSALKCFGEKGYHSTTMDDIVAYSNMSKGLLYNYFKSKEELYISLIEYRSEKTLADIRTRIEPFPAAVDKIREFFRIFRDITLTEEWRRFIRVQLEFWIFASRQEHLREIMNSRYKNQFRSFMAEIIEEGKAAGEFGQEVKVDIIASLFWSFVDGICLHYSLLWEDYSYTEHFKETEEMVLNYIAAK